MPRFHTTPTGNIPFTAEEETQRDAEEQAWNDKSAERKLTMIKFERNLRLQQTDYMANSDYTMPENIKTWRQSLRDIPQNNTTEEQYDLLLAREIDKLLSTYGNLTNEIWSKP
tara:strand:- start:206 stop:544 length:339 start_codon:yes stop_codon:yes gene_type:complete